MNVDLFIPLTIRHDDKMMNVFFDVAKNNLVKEDFSELDPSIKTAILNKFKPSLPTIPTLFKNILSKI